jgi:hypothetical protein
MSNELATLTELRAAINAEHEKASQTARQALEHARRAGELLIQAKALVAHGQWLPWLQTNCECAERTATAYMKIAREWSTLESKSATGVADLTVRGALQELAEPRQHQAALPLDPGLESWRPKLEEAEQRMLDAMCAYLMIGEELRLIRDKCLYKASGAETFERFCENRLDMSAREVDSLIKAAAAITAGADRRDIVRMWNEAPH